MKEINLVGKRFGRILIISRSPLIKGRHHLWEGVCDCGKNVILRGEHAQNKETQSCGCFKLERLSQKPNSLTHGFRRSQNRSGENIKRIFYYRWYSMRRRCNDIKERCFANYGGRGISVCRNWLQFENFRDDMFESFKEHVKLFGIKQTSIERIDNNRNYSRENCRWATSKEQNRNKRNSIILTHDGITQSLPKWAEKISISRGALYLRLFRHGWSIEKSLTIPTK